MAIFEIDLFYDIEEQVWIATSDDVKGLVVESDSWEQFMKDIPTVTIMLLRDTDLKLGDLDLRLSEPRVLHPLTIPPIERILDETPGKSPRISMQRVAA